MFSAGSFHLITNSYFSGFFPQTSTWCAGWEEVSGFSNAWKKNRKTGLKQVPTFKYNEVILHSLFNFEIHLIGHSKSKDQ